MSDLDEVYERLAEKFGRKGSQEYMEQMEAMMTPDEGHLMLELAVRMTPGELAVKLNLEEKTLAEKLDNMAQRGLLYREKGQYISWPDAHQLGVRVSHSKDEYIPPRLIELRKKSGRSGSMSETPLHIKRFEETGVAVHRVIPSRLAILANPEIKPGQVFWYEDMAQLIERAGGFGVVDCPCRRNRGNCDRPLWVCMHFRKNIIEYEVGRSGRMRAQGVEEAIATSDLAETSGLVHVTPYNSAQVPGVVCNCCSCCCGVLTGAIASGEIKKVLSPSRFRPTVKQELCIGCQDCVTVCPFDAIEMQKVPDSKKLKAVVDKEKCMGCGVCVLQCKQKSLVFELVRPPGHIPIKQIGPPVGSAQVTT